MAIAQTAISLCNRRVTSVGLYYSVCGIDGIYYRHDAALQQALERIQRQPIVLSSALLTLFSAGFSAQASSQRTRREIYCAAGGRTARRALAPVRPAPGSCFAAADEQSHCATADPGYAARCLPAKPPTRSTQPVTGGSRPKYFGGWPPPPGPILSVFPALIVHSELKSVHPGFPVAFIF